MSVKEPKAKATGKGAVQTPSRKPKNEKIDSKSKVKSKQQPVTIPDGVPSAISSETVSTPTQSAKKKPTGSSAKKAATVIPQANTQESTPLPLKSTTDKKVVSAAKEVLSTTPLPSEIKKPTARKKTGIPAKATKAVADAVQPTLIKVVQPPIVEVVRPLVAKVVQSPIVERGQKKGKGKSPAAKKGASAPSTAPAHPTEVVRSINEAPAAVIPPQVVKAAEPSTTIIKKRGTTKPAKAAIAPSKARTTDTALPSKQGTTQSSEPPAPPVDDVWSARLQAIDARYGNVRTPAPATKVTPPTQDVSLQKDTPQKEKPQTKQNATSTKPAQNQKKNIPAKQAEQVALQQVPELTTSAESISEETDDDTPKLSYWQQRRLNKKLKQQASQSGGESVQTTAAASVSPAPTQPSVPLPVKRDVSPTKEEPNPILVEAILKALEENETANIQAEVPHPIIKEAILQALEENKDTTSDSVIDETDENTPKLSYWQQRRLNKKLKQQANPGEQRTTTEQSIPSVPAIEPIKIPVNQIQSQTIPQSIPEVAPQTKESIPDITENSAATPSDSDEEAPKLSYWQQRRLNKKLKQQAFKTEGSLTVHVEPTIELVPEVHTPLINTQQVNTQQVNTPKTQPSTLQPFVTRKEAPIAPVPIVEAIQEAIQEVPVVIPKKLTKVQQRQLDKKLKLQAEEDARLADAASIALAAQNIEPAEDETLTADSPMPDSLDEEPIAPKLSYWQQRRLNKKLKQLTAKPEDTEALATEQVTASPIVKAEIAPEVVIEESSISTESLEPPKKLTYWQQKRLNKKLAKQKELEQAGLLQQEDSIVKESEVPVEKRILPVPEGKRILPVPEGKKILPVPENKKVLPVPDGKKILPVPEGKKILPVPEGKKILPVPEKKAQPHVKKEFDHVIEQVPIPPLVAPKTQYPPKPLPVLPPFPDELREMVARVEHFMIHELNVYHEATILLGVSGGVDSMVMLDIFAYLSHKYDFSIHVGHCNHHLRGEDSLEDERMVKRVTHKYGLYYHHTSLKVQEFADKHKNSVEQAARTLRYHFFEKMAKTTVSGFVATAHTADDSAETFLLNLLRGSGLTGLAGIPARRELSKRVHVIRPLLPLLKSEVIQYATVRGLEWREDASNKSLLYTRNKIRLQLLPTLKEQFSPAIVETINRTARLLLGADEIVNERAEALISMMLRSVGKSAVAISIPHFESVNDFLKGEIIQKILKEKFQTLPVSMHTIDRIIDLATGAENAMCRVTPAIDALRDRQEIILRKNNVLEVINHQIPKTGKLNTDTFSLSMKELTKKDVKFSDNPNIEFLDADLVPLWLTIRSWQDGDRIQPLGMAGSMTVGDFLTNEKVELIDKERTLVLCAGTEVIWICGRRVSDKFKVGPTTKRIICAEFTSKTEPPIKQETQK